MIIKEIIERDCCDPQKDLKVYKGELTEGSVKKPDNYSFCIYCGQIWVNKQRTDAAGSRESILIKMAI